MSAKESAAVGQLMSLMESRYAMRVLWALLDGEPQTFRALQASIGSITPNTLNTRLKELRQAALVNHEGEGYFCTQSGAELVKRLSDLSPFALKWASAQARKRR